QEFLQRRHHHQREDVRIHPVEGPSGPRSEKPAPLILGEWCCRRRKRDSVCAHLAGLAARTLPLPFQPINLILLFDSYLRTSRNSFFFLTSASAETFRCAARALRIPRRIPAAGISLRAAP